MLLKFLNLWKLLDFNVKRNFFFIVLITIFGGFFEMIGIGLIIPVLTTIVNNNSHPLIESLFRLTGFEYIGYIQIIFIFISFIIFKNLILLFVTFLQYRMLSEIKHMISCKLFKNYIKLNYSYYLKHNSSEITRNLTTAITQLYSFILVPLSVFLTEFFILIFLIVFSIILNPSGSLILFTSLFLPSFIFFNYTKFKVKVQGSFYSNNEELRIKYINEMIGAIRDIKLHNKEEFFIKKYIKSDFICSLAQFKLTFFNQIAKYLLEISLIFAIFVFTLAEFLKGSSFNDIIPILGFYSFVGFKATPSLNRILATSQSITYGEPVIDMLNEEFIRKLPQSDVSKVHIDAIKKGIYIKNLSFSYNSKNIIDKLNLTIKKGDVIGITGKTGSGKSTLLNLLLGFLNPSKGKIFIDDIDLSKKNIDFRNLIGYVPQEIFLIDDTLLNNIAFCLSNNDINLNHVKWAIKEAGLEEFVNGLELGIYTRVGERGVRISGGQRQRIGIARALFFGARVLIFDEATSALDSETEKLVMENISRLKNKYTIILVAHRLSTLKSCNKLYELVDKRLKIRHI